MTDVVILRNIAGHKRGDVVPHEPWLDGHVKAGNAKVVPNDNAAWHEEPAPAPAPVLQTASTGIAADLKLEAELDKLSEDSGDSPWED